MWIMISGPYRSGSKNPAVWQENLDELNKAALKIFELGHTPIIGVNMALPICNVASESQYSELMMPISFSLAQKCDAVVRIGGPSKGADQEVADFIKRKLPGYKSLKDIKVHLNQ